MVAFHVWPSSSGNFTYNGRYTVGSAANPMSIEEYVGPVGNFFLSLTATDDCTPVTVAMRGQSHDETRKCNKCVFETVTNSHKQ